MISITQPKISGLKAEWARFPGFSFLFDAPAGHFRNADGVETLACDLTTPGWADFLVRVSAGLEEMNPDHLLRSYGFCPLPTASYHVTAFDVSNFGQLHEAKPERLDQLTRTLEAVPGPEAFDAEEFEYAHEWQAKQPHWGLKFKFKELGVWPNVIALTLEATDSVALNSFVESRAAMSRHYRTTYGVGASEKFTPHLSLGYFLNEEGAGRAKSMQSEWDSVMRHHIGEAPLDFDHASLYGFTDMATFFRRTT